MAITFKDVAEILKMIDASQCQELVVELDGLRLVVRRGRPQAANSGPDRAVVEDVSESGPARSSGAAATHHAAKRFAGARADLAPAEGRIAVRAPMVGSFYRRPSPEEKPFVEVGERVKTGDPLCVIDVMKLFTTIAAPADGVVEAIPATDGSAVEFDQILFIIKPD
jgi:acetyl-CoA carboxylase biotin carboxyl carrier protein